MFYSIHNKEIREISLEQLDFHDICVGYLTLDELKSCYQELGLSEVAVKDCMTDFTHFRTSMDVYDEFSFGMINIVDILNLSTRRNRIGFFIKKNLFVMVKIIDKEDSIRQMFLDAIQKYATGRKSLLGFSYLLHLILASFTGVYLVTFSIVGPILGPMFDKYDLDRKNLSRMLEDTGTAFSPIVPWSNISIFILGTLGVSSFQYVLYAPITYLGVVFAAIYIMTGFGIFNRKGEMLIKEKK